LTLAQNLSDIDNAAETVASPDRRHALSTDGFARLQQFLLSDSYAFAQIVCGHNDLVPELHMPLSYAACGLTDKLIATLNASGFDSYVTRKLRRALWERGIDWTTSEGRIALDKQLDFLNIRWFRGSYKSSCITHAGTTFMSVRDPNITAKITHATDEKAWEFCGQIGDTIRSGIFQDLFPDRVPQGNLNELVTQKRITVGGRTVSRPQTTIQAGGYLTKDIGGHYDLFVIDDLVMERNATPEHLKGVHTWLRNLTGYYINAPGVRVRRIHVGTKWDENDDDTYLTTGKMATRCLTIRVPIEEYEGEVVNILERGRPTIPQLYTTEKVSDLQAAVLNSDEDVDGARSWRCNYLLDAYAGGQRLFPASLVDDPDRSWLGPYVYPGADKRPEYRDRFLVARYLRDAEGRPLDKKDRPLDVKADADWRTKAKTRVYDPWRDLDRVMTLDPSWVQGGNNWAVTAGGIDPEGVAFVLETRSGTDGMEGWIEAVADLDAIYRPRVIGFGAGGYQDPMVQNLLKTDKRLRRLRNRVVSIKEGNTTKPARIRGGVAEPLRMYRLLLDRSELGQATRDEMKAYKGDAKAVDGILDSLWMIFAVAKRKRTPEEREESARLAMEADKRRRRQIDPALGVPVAA
jgi:hypothetical protein